MRWRSSSHDCTRMCRRKVRSILPKRVYTMLSHEPCFGVSTYWKRLGRQADPSIFSTEFNREGIQIGTGIALLLRNRGEGTNAVQYREFWGKNKRYTLVRSLHDDADHPYDSLTPSLALGLPFLNATVAVG